MRYDGAPVRQRTVMPPAGVYTSARVGGVMDERSSTKPRIAILEDHEDTRDLLRVALSDAFSVRDFRDAADLLAALEQETFSVVVADIMLPGLDGYALIRTLRNDPRFADQCVIALTALAMAADREKAMTAGFTDYLVKPITPDEIERVVSTYCTRSS